MTNNEKEILENTLSSVTEKLVKVETIEEQIKDIKDVNDSKPISNVTLNDVSTLQNIKSQALTLLNNNTLTNEQKTELENILDDISNKLDKVNEIKTAIDNIKQVNNNVSFDNVASNNKEELNNANKSIDTILSENKDNLTNAQKEELNAIKEELDNKIEKIKKMETSADYSKIDSLIKKINELDEDDYTTASLETLQNAVNNIDRSKNQLQQDEVDQMFEQLKSLFNSLENSGKAIKDDNEKDNFGNSNIISSDKELKSIIPFTASEKSLIKEGTDAVIGLEIKDIKDTITDVEKKLIDENIGNNKIGAYFDISLYKQVGNNDKVKITETNDKIKISFEIPESLMNINSNVTRTFYIVRVHDDSVEKLDTTVEGNIATFETDKFSTYALAYTDTINSNNPKTGDNIMNSIILLSMSLMGLICSIFYILKNNKKKSISM